MLRSFFGSDVFIAYSHRDGSRYAQSLAHLLSELGFACAIDVWSQTGSQFATNIKRQLRGTRALIVIASPAAMLSRSLQEEIHFYRSRTARGTILPIVFGAGSEAVASLDLHGLAWITEPAESLHEGGPSASTIDRVQSSLTFATRQRRLRTTAAMTVVATSALMLGLAGMAYSTRRQLLRARQEIATLRTEVAGLKAGQQRETMTGSAPQTRLKPGLDSGSSGGTPAVRVPLPFWVLLTTGVALSYGAACAILLYTRPMILIRFHNAVYKTLRTADAPNSLVKSVMFVITTFGVTFLVRHRRCRTSWAQEFLNHRCKLSDLDEPIRSYYIKQEEIIDAFVSRNVRMAQVALERQTSLLSQSDFIPIPFSDITSGQSRQVDEPSRLDLLFETGTSIAVILGDGGTGKTSLAAQFTYASIDANPRLRLMPRLMLPVIWADDTVDLVESLRIQLKAMLEPDEEVARDLLEQLLSTGRVLAVIDGFSERTRETQAHIRQILQNRSIRSAILTSRTDPSLEPIQYRRIELKGIAGRLSFFISSYVRRSAAMAVMSADDAWLLAQQLIDIFKKTTQPKAVTPLLIKLLIDDGIDRARVLGRVDAERRTMAEAVVSYVRRLVPKTAVLANDADMDEHLGIARVLANVALSGEYVPRPFYIDEARKAVRDNLGIDGDASIQRLINNQVLGNSSVAGTTKLKFELDPVAEYLAAFFWLDRLRGDSSGWNSWIESIKSVSGYPDQMRGFLVALSECSARYRSHFDLPRLHLPWEEQ